MAVISVKFVINFCFHFGNCKIKIISFSWFCFSYPFCRNPVSSQMQQGGNGRGQERIIDLHGLHVSEAIHVLKRDLAMLRSAAARSGEQRLQVYICVGTGHHTRGSRTPARLPTAVQRYLLEEEGLDFTEPQPGLLRVVIYWSQWKGIGVLTQNSITHVESNQQPKRKRRKSCICIWGRKNRKKEYKLAQSGEKT